ELAASPVEMLARGEPCYITHTFSTMLSADGHRRYEFMIEYDIYNPSQGIYFGCKSVTLYGHDHKSETANALADWQLARPFVTLRLNNVFVDKDFTYRYKDTDNDADLTFWPFWISLYEDESPVDVAVRALKIIAGVYDELIGGKLPEYQATSIVKTESSQVRTAFTHQAYDNFLHQISKYISEVSPLKDRTHNLSLGRQFIEYFLVNAERHGLIHRAPSYECAWMMDARYSDVDFNAMIKSMIEELQIRLGISGMKTPWNDAIRLFMRSDERPYKLQVKTLPIKSDTATKISTLVKKIMENE
ncbi:MAG: hypothetical protein K2J10_11735, partial [Muribaculaceae bacterium]|nr:hypothetical protein [Muribaculaceae bacterium]